MTRPWGRRDALLAGASLAGAAVAACRAPSTPPPPSTAQPTSQPSFESDPAAVALLQQMEQRLLSAKSVRMTLTVQLVRADEFHVKGSVVVKPENVVSMDLAADVRGETVPVFLEANGAQAKGGLRTKAFVQGVPPTLRVDVLKALANKGLAQVVMDLLAGAMPQSAEVEQQWAKLGRFALGSRGTVGGRQVQTVNFDTQLDGQETGRGTLWVAADTALPLLRTTYVRHPVEVVAIERYDSLQLDDQ
jgi:hypothetical protein